jgi:large subunit ribosomal protein L23
MLSSNLNQYLFSVASTATKPNIKRAIESTFSVKVLKVNTINVKPKSKRDRTRRNKLGFKSGMKKAIVTLQSGDSIDLA